MYYHLSSISVLFLFSESIDIVISIKLSLLTCRVLFVVFCLDPNSYISNKLVTFYLGIYHLMRISRNNLSHTHLGLRIPISMGFYSTSGLPGNANLGNMAPSRSLENFVDVV